VHNRLLTPSEILLTLTGAWLVDRSALLILVVAGAATSGAREYEVVHDAGKTGRRCLRIELIIKIWAIEITLRIIRWKINFEGHCYIPVASFALAERDPEDFQPSKAARLLWLQLYHLWPPPTLKFWHRWRPVRLSRPEMVVPLCPCCDSIGRLLEWWTGCWTLSADDLFEKYTSLWIYFRKIPLY